MRKSKRFFALFVCAVILGTCFSPLVSAKSFSTGFDTENLGINTQYKYTENDPSWLRLLTVKEDMLSVDGIINEAVLYPITGYPYRTDAKTFKKEVDGYVETFTLDEESQKAAYLYVINQLGALTVISEPTIDDDTKAKWLRRKGITVTPEDEASPDGALMISALYALMRNDFYYVVTGKTVEIPEGTGVEEAVMLYLMAFAGQNNTLVSFIQKYFGTSSIGTLEDYIYYTSLMTLFTRGYISISEIPTLSRNEVYRRVAIMTIREYGLSVDANADMEEIQIKYLAAMLGQQYEIQIDPDALKKDVKKGNTAHYIIRRMAYEDANITISEKTSYEEAFEIALKQTHKFDLENEFYSDIKDYNVYLNNLRDGVYINPTPLSTSGVTVLINGTPADAGAYTKVMLTPDTKQTIGISVSYSEGKVKKNSYYRLNIYQGQTPGKDSELTGLVSEVINNVTVLSPDGNAVQNPVENIAKPAVSYINNVTPSLYDVAQRILSLNEKGQLVDQDGNVISDNAETLPAGYIYSIDSNGELAIVPAAEQTDTTTQTDTQSTSSDENSEKTRNIIIAASLFVLIALIIIIAAVLHATNKKKKRRSGSNSKKAKEKKKKEKQAAKAAKKK